MKTKYMLKVTAMLCVVITLIVTTVNGQEKTFQFAGSTMLDKTLPSYMIKSTNNEYLILNDATRNPGWIPSVVREDFFYLTKLDNNGNLIFNKEIKVNNPSSEGFNCVSGLLEANNGDFLIAGYYLSGSGLGLGTSSFLAQPFVMRVDNNGNYLWTKFYQVSTSFFIPMSDMDRIAFKKQKDGNSYLLSSCATSPIRQHTGINVLNIDDNGDILWGKTMYDMATMGSPDPYYSSISNITYHPKDIIYCPNTGHYIIGGHARIDNIYGNTDFKIFFIEIDGQGNAISDIVWYGDHYSALFLGEMIFDDESNTIVFSHFSQAVNSLITGSRVHAITGVTSMDVGFNVNFEKRYFGPWELNNRSLSKGTEGYYLGNVSVVLYTMPLVYERYPSMLHIDGNGGVINYAYYNYAHTNNTYHVFDGTNLDLALVGGINNNFLGGTVTDDFVFIKPSLYLSSCNSADDRIYEYDDPQDIAHRDHGEQEILEPVELEVLYNDKSVAELVKCDKDNYNVKSIKNENITVFPTVISESEGELSVRNNTGSTINVSIYDMTGKLICQEHGISAICRIPLANFIKATGVYIVSFTDNTGKFIKTEKIISN